MKITNPRSLLDKVDLDRFKTLCDFSVAKEEEITISEPCPFIGQSQLPSTFEENEPEIPFESVIQGRIQRFDDHIDTDAIIPAEFMPGTSDEDLGTHCFQYVRPEFREMVSQGLNIVVAGVGFGSGSSREEAPRALKGCGVKAVIAKSYAYIYGRNQPNMALLGVIVKDEHFYHLAQQGEQISLDIPKRIVSIQGKEFPFDLSPMEEILIRGGGVTELYRKYGRGLFRAAMSQGQKGTEKKLNSSCHEKQELTW